MHSRLRTGIRWSAALLLAAALPACGAADAAQPGPADVVATLYRDHFAHGQNWDATYQRRRALFAPELAKLLDDDLRASAANADEIVGLDFDPLTNAQDSMAAFDVAPATRDGADALVPVVVRQDGARTSLRVRLTRAGGGWRVSNIAYPEGDLVSILRQVAADRRPKP